MKAATAGAPRPSALLWIVAAVVCALLWINRNRLAAAAYRANGFPPGY